MEPQATRTPEPRPFISDDIVRRAVAGTCDPSEVRILATAASRLAEKLADVLRNGAEDRDFPIMERAQATRDAIDAAFHARQGEEARARAQQPSMFAAGEIHDGVMRILRGPLPAHSIAR